MSSRTTPVSFYDAHYQRAFPFVLAELTDPVYRTPLEQFTYCYGVRTFERELNWFGLLGPEPSRQCFTSPTSC